MKDTGANVHATKWLTSNGQRVFLELHYEPVRNADSEIVGIGVAAVNLTEQELAKEALRESEEKHRNIIETANEGLITVEAGLIHKDGSLVSVLVNSSPIRDKDGRFAGSLGMVTDITERRKAEEELQRSQDRFKALIQNVNSGVALIDEYGKFTIVNPAFLQIQRYRRWNAQG